MEVATHLGVFGVATCVWWLALPRQRPWVAGLAFAAAVLAEALQHVAASHRNGTLEDVVANGVGVACGLAVAAVISAASARAAPEASGDSAGRAL